MGASTNSSALVSFLHLRLSLQKKRQDAIRVEMPALATAAVGRDGIIDIAILLHGLPVERNAMPG
jgi:hypothetical protein